MPGYTRRSFLAQAAAVAGTLYLNRRVNADAPKAPRITRIETWPVMYPTVGRFKFLEGPRGEPRGRPTVVVKITAEDGSVGWGQSVPSHRWSYETVETVRSTLDRYLAPVLIGMDPFDFDGIHAAMNRIIAPAFSTGQPICKAGVDLALHDLAGRLRRQSAAAKWGGKDARRQVAGATSAHGQDARATVAHGQDARATKVLLSWTLNPKTLDEIEGLIAEGRRRGYWNFNVKVAPDPKFDIEMCRMVKRLAPDGFLWADANGGYDEATALAVAPKLADAGVAVLEQPVPANRLGALRKLKKLGALPIILDEGVVSVADLEEFIALDLLDGVAMKPARCGGLTEARRQIELLQKHGLMFLGSGLTDPDLSLAASLLLFGAYDYARPAALNGPQFLTDTTILKKAIKAVDGYLPVPTGPGLGVEVDEEQLRRLAVRG